MPVRKQILPGKEASEYVLLAWSNQFVAENGCWIVVHLRFAGILMVSDCLLSYLSILLNAFGRETKQSFCEISYGPKGLGGRRGIDACLSRVREQTKLIL